MNAALPYCAVSVTASHSEFFQEYEPCLRRYAQDGETVVSQGPLHLRVSFSRANPVHDAVFSISISGLSPDSLVGPAVAAHTAQGCRSKGHGVAGTMPALVCPRLAFITQGHLVLRDRMARHRFLSDDRVPVFGSATCIRAGGFSSPFLPPLLTYGTSSGCGETGIRGPASPQQDGCCGPPASHFECCCLQVTRSGLPVSRFGVLFSRMLRGTSRFCWCLVAWRPSMPGPFFPFRGNLPVARRSVPQILSFHVRRVHA